MAAGFGSVYGVGPYGYEEDAGVLRFAVTQLGVNTLRLIFSDPVQKNEALLNPATYSVVPTSGGVGVLVAAVEPEIGSSTPEYVDLTISELTGEASFNGYQAVVVTDVIISNTGTLLSAPNNVVAFTASPFRPRVVKAVPTDSSSVDVEFSESMEDNSPLRDPDSYVINGGLSVRSVYVVSSRKVRLFVEPSMATDQLYTVSVVG